MNKAVASQVLAGGIAILNTVRTDDGDHDGFADTKETVSFRLTVQNTTGVALSGVTAQLTADDGGLACVSVPAITIGNLAVSEIKLTDPFVFSVRSNLDRSGLGLSPYDELSVAFGITFSSQAGPVPAYPPLLELDLDLDVAGGADPMSFFETFEGTLGAFEIDNMDQGLTSLQAADGYRCQIFDPDWVHNYNHNIPEAEQNCYPGLTSAHAEAVFWGLSGPAFSAEGGRGFTGFHSLFFGIDLGPPLNWTTPFSALEVVRTTNPIALDWSGAAPKLSFKHQTSLVDDYASQIYNFGFDRGVVMAQVADDAGQPVGDWFKLYPFQNPYVDLNSTNTNGICAFDPIDDGNTEDDFFDPTDPSRTLGPSSTCGPGPVFMEMGETSNPFHTANVGSADGPGLEGQWGIGTWIESKVDLGRFRGRQVRLRFLASTIRISSHETWEDFAGDNPQPDDDGWWIDDVTINQVLTTPATVTVDTQDNSALPGAPGPDSDGDGMHDVCDHCDDVVTSSNVDSDGDGFGDACDTCPFDPASADGTDLDGDSLCVDNCPTVFNPNQQDTDSDTAGNACDCAFLDPTIYPGAVEINDAKDNQCPGEPGYGVVDELSGTTTFCDPTNKNKYCWSAQQGATHYRVARASKANYTQGCLQFPQTTQLFIVDATAVPPGEIRFYLVRPRLPNPGSWGQNSAGQARTVPCL